MKIIDLIKRVIQGTASQEQKDDIDRFLLESFHAEQWDPATHGDKDEVKNRIVSGVTRSIHRGDRSAKRINVWRFTKAAAVLAVLGLAAYWGVQTFSSADPGHPAMALAPGSDKASLELSDGTTVDLSEQQIGDTWAYGNFRVRKTDAGTIHYQYIDPSVPSAAEEGNWNTLTTPKGGKYTLVLSDGTSVWLNAESSIRFPDRFSGDLRQVSVSGEVFFEVAHDKSQPFIVRAKDLDIRVLGTSFNVSTYEDAADDPSVALLEGSVQLHAHAHQINLLPGEKAMIADGAFQKSSFDAESEIAWKDDYFVFKDQNIKAIMNELARWYDAEVDYEGKDWESKNFTVRISRREQIDEILSLIELTKSVQFSIKGRRITVKEI